MHEFIRSATSFERLATVRVRGAFEPRAERKREFAQRDGARIEWPSLCARKSERFVASEDRRLLDPKSLIRAWSLRRSLRFAWL